MLFSDNRYGDGSRVLTFPGGEGGTRSVSDEGKILNYDLVLAIWFLASSTASGPPSPLEKDGGSAHITVRFYCYVA